MTLASATVMVTVVATTTGEAMLVEGYGVVSGDDNK